MKAPSLNKVHSLGCDDVLKDNDPRMPGRTVVVCGFDKYDGDEDFKVLVRSSSGRIHKIARSRIFLDSKARKSGWSRVGQ